MIKLEKKIHVVLNFLIIELLLYSHFQFFLFDVYIPLNSSFHQSVLL